MRSSQIDSDSLLGSHRIGMKLRALRIQRRLTLSKVAELAGLSSATLSKLENDQMIPTLQTLASICRVYSVGLGHFFLEPAYPRLSITRGAHLKNLTPAGSERLSLGTGDRSDCLAAEMVEITSKVATAQNLPPTAACAFIYVLEGTLQLIAGPMRDLLQAGDCAYVHSAMPLAWSATGKDRCRILLVQPLANPSVVSNHDAETDLSHDSVGLCCEKPNQAAGLGSKS